MFCKKKCNYEVLPFCIHAVCKRYFLFRFECKQPLAKVVRMTKIDTKNKFEIAMAIEIHSNSRHKDTMHPAMPNDGRGINTLYIHFVSRNRMGQHTFLAAWSCFCRSNWASWVLFLYSISCAHAHIHSQKYQYSTPCLRRKQPKLFLS